MIRDTRRWIKWLLSGVAFATVAAAAGCSMLPSFSRRASVQPRPIPVIDLDPVPWTPELQSGASDEPVKAPIAPAEPKTEAVVVKEQKPPAKLNVFGEVDGVQRSNVRGDSEVNFQQHTWADEGFDSDVAADPKGRWIVFSSTRNSDHANIYLQKTQGTSVVQLTSDNADDAYPVFSADGSRIAFCSTRSGNWDIYTMDQDGRHVMQVTNGPMQEIHPSFSPDGMHLVYCALNPRGGQWELWTVDLNTGVKRMIGYGLFPSWSPTRDKNEIAYQKSRARGSRWFSLWTLDLVDGEARAVTEVAVSSNSAIVSPSWSPDGQKLSFSTIVEPARTQNSKPVGQQDIWTINADGSNRRRITDGNGVCATPFWSSDNRIYFVSNRSGNDCIWSTRAGDADAATAALDTKEQN